MSDRISPTEYVEYYASYNTRMAYLSGLKRYFEIITETKIELSQLDDSWMKYLTGEKFDPIRDLIRFPRLAQEKGLAPFTINAYLKPAELYLKEIWEIQLTDQQRKMRRRSEPKYHSISKPANLKREQIAKILSYSGIRMRCEILIAVSSGLRISEILSLEFSDIDLDAKPPTLRIRAKNSKNKIERVVHISVEATEAMKIYLSVRDTDLRCGRSHEEAEIAKNSDKIIPFTRSTEESNFREIVEKAGLLELDENTGRSVIHFHSFRAFFSTRAHKSEAPDTFVEYLMGHSGYLTSAYWQPSDEDRAEMYAMIEPLVTINIPDDYFDIKVKQAKEIEELRAALLHQQSITNATSATVELLQAHLRIMGVSHLPRLMNDGDENDRGSIE